MIVAVTGGKGGVGKSTVSLNLARELDAVVVDGDLSTADLPRGTGPDLHDVLAGQADPTDAVERFWTIDLLPCGRTLEGARAANLERFETTVDVLQREYGWVVIDSPAGLARDVGVQIESADVTVMVTNPDPAAIQDVFRTRGLAMKLETPTGAVALNKADRTTAKVIEEDLESKLGAPVTPIPEQAEVNDAQEDWVPVRDAAPKSHAVEPFETLANRVRQCERRVLDHARA